ncbi:MAG: hypothetical protein AAF393_06035 [Pseudomonadota bacterium]
MKDFGPLSFKESGSPNTPDLGSIAKNNNLAAVFHCLKSSAINFFLETSHSDEPFNIAGLPPNHCALKHRFRAKEVCKPTFQ